LLLPVQAFQFKDVRRKAKFIKPKIVIRTSNKGITPGPKAAARPTIQSRMATVKIVQNTALLPHVLPRFKKFEQAVRFKVVARPEGPLGQGPWVNEIIP
jgi:hypothetical protein